MSAVLRVSWAYSLRKEDLSSYLAEFGCEVGGTVDEQRKRFAQFLAEQHDPNSTRRLLQLQAKHETSSQEPKSLTPRKVPQVVISNPEGAVVAERSDAPGTSPAQATQAPGPPPMADHRGSQPSAPAENVLSNSSSSLDVKTIADQVRKWSIGFDGERDPLEFVERVEELSGMYQISADRIPPLMPEALTGKALIWYRNNNLHWPTWAAFRRDFLKLFLPLRYFEHLEDEIRKRRQRPRETFKTYALAMQNLMRHSECSTTQKLERIFRNALPEYQWYIRRRDFLSLEDLLEMAEDMEGIPAMSPTLREQHRQITPEEEQQEPRINVRTACRRCGHDGHFANQCQGEVLLFCWICGRRSIRTIQCCRRRPGNENRDRIERGGTDPHSHSPPRL